MKPATRKTDLRDLTLSYMAWPVLCILLYLKLITFDIFIT
jgi:hypothetical protein